MQVVIPRHSFVTLCSAEAFVKKKKHGKEGKVEKRGKAGKAREKGKSEESLCQISVEIWQKLSISDRTQPPPPQGNGTSEVV